MSLGGGSGDESIPTLVAVLVVAVAGWLGAGGRVNVAWLLVLARGTVVVGGDAISVGGAKATRYPSALDGGAELQDEFGIALSGDGSCSVGA
jgi:hypothetical protein